MKKRISLKTREERITRRRRYHYNSNTPFVDLIKPEYHHVFHQWYNNELKKFLRGTDGIEYFEIHQFDFKLVPYSKDLSYSAFVFSLAKFLSDIGKGDGLKVKLSMIFRYITDKKRSNLPLSEDRLKRLVYNAFKLIN